MYPILQPYQNQLQNLQNQIINTAPAIQYVNDRASAENYQMQPNSSVILMDSNVDRFYLKKADASGSCTVTAYDFHEAEEEPKTEYVTRKEFNELKKLIEEKGNEQSNGRKRNDASNGRNDARRVSTDVSSESSAE
jgi:hypothetical protein